MTGLGFGTLVGAYVSGVVRLAVGWGVAIGLGAVTWTARGIATDVAALVAMPYAVAHGAYNAWCFKPRADDTEQTGPDLDRPEPKPLDPKLDMNERSEAFA